MSAASGWLAEPVRARTDVLVRHPPVAGDRRRIDGLSLRLEPAIEEIAESASRRGRVATFIDLGDEPCERRSASSLGAMHGALGVALPAVRGSRPT